MPKRLTAIDHAPPLPPGYSWTKRDDGGGAPAIITPRRGWSISGRYRGERHATMAARAEDAWADYRAREDTP